MAKSKELNNWTDLSGKKVCVWGNKVKCSDGKKRMLFSTTLGKKDKDGKWDNIYFDVRFIGESPESEGATNILIEEGFISFSEFNGTKNPCLVVKDFSEI